MNGLIGLSPYTQARPLPSLTQKMSLVVVLSDYSLITEGGEVAGDVPAPGTSGKEGTKMVKGST